MACQVLKDWNFICGWDDFNRGGSVVSQISKTVNIEIAPVNIARLSGYKL